MKHLFLTVTLFSVTLLYAQAPEIEWQKSLGGSGMEVAFSIQQTSDGGYITAGYSNSNDGDVSGNHGDRDYWIVKLDNAGNLEWQKSIGGSHEDWAYSIQQTSDGGYIAAGYTFSNNGDVSGNHGASDYWVVKLDDTGNIQWQKCLGGSGYDSAKSIQQTSDGGYIVAGSSESNDGDVSGNHGGYGDYWVVKLDESGNIQWQKCLGGSDDDYYAVIQQTSDGGYIVAGASWSSDGDVTGNHNSTDYWIVKLDIAGTIQWEKSLGGSSEDWPESIQQTSDGGYIVAGESKSNDGDVTGNHDNGEQLGDYWAVKLDATGNIQWEKSLGGSEQDWAYSIQQTFDGGYIVAGYSYSNDGDVSGNHGNSDYWAVKLDDSGTIQWQKTLGGNGWDVATATQQTLDGGYIIAGVSMSNDGDVSGNHGGADVWIVKLAGSGVTTYEITTSSEPAEGGTTTGGGIYNYGASVTVSAFANADYSFVNWTEDGTEVSNHTEYTFIVTENRDLVANFEEIATHEITTSSEPAEGGTTTGGGIYNYGASVTVSAFANAGYSFINWTEGGTEVSIHTEYTFVVTENRDLIANFEEIATYEITTSSNPEEGGTTSGGGVFEYGTSVTVSAFAYADYSFVNWTEDGTEVSNDTEYTFVAIENRNTVANFDYEMAVADIENNRIKIYPNPVTGLLTIKGISLKTELIITNTYGEIVFKTVAKNNELTIDVSELPAGMYFINGQKFIKK
ncbi:MAG: T9SS type A sorting domain-containing protein [Bacteroidales bacterium]|nr:T9SS type A sorting domain-containing protein [Bacteroidales bacterium]